MRRLHYSLGMIPQEEFEEQERLEAALLEQQKQGSKRLNKSEQLEKQKEKSRQSLNENFDQLYHGRTN